MSTGTDRRRELLAERALDGLSDADARELDGLGGAGDDSFDLAAAAAALAELERDLAPMPQHLQRKVLERAGKPRARRPRWDRGRAFGWLLATAAMVLAVFGWLRPPEVVERVQVVEAPPPRPVPAAEARRALLAEAPDAKTVPWSATPDPAAKGAEGDVVWSASRQQGYMRFRGLARNDPRAQQYQLWIFDGARDPRYPVDGGVFDVVDGEVVVPIHARIGVRQAKLFAVTVEKPGGVVVSDRERIVLTAAL